MCQIVWQFLSETVSFRDRDVPILVSLRDRDVPISSLLQHSFSSRNTTDKEASFTWGYSRDRRNSVVFCCGLMEYFVILYSMYERRVARIWKQNVLAVRSCLSFTPPPPQIHCLRKELNWKETVINLDWESYFLDTSFVLCERRETSRTPLFARKVHFITFSLNVFYWPWNCHLTRDLLIQMIGLRLSQDFFNN
jgi:hypothetical protein